MKTSLIYILVVLVGVASGLYYMRRSEPISNLDQVPEAKVCDAKSPALCITPTSGPVGSKVRMFGPNLKPEQVVWFGVTKRDKYFSLKPIWLDGDLSFSVPEELELCDGLTNLDDGVARICSEKVMANETYRIRNQHGDPENDRTQNDLVDDMFFTVN